MSKDIEEEQRKNEDREVVFYGSPDEILVLSDSVDRLTEAIRDLNGLIRDQGEIWHEAGG